jgi:hypothetical protein
MVSSGLLRRVALVRTDVSEETGASFIRVTKIGELGTTRAATSNRRTLRRNTTVFLRRRRWIDNIKMDLSEMGLNLVDWIGLAQDRYRWRALVSSVMNLRVP